MGRRFVPGKRDRACEKTHRYDVLPGWACALHMMISAPIAPLKKGLTGLLVTVVVLIFLEGIMSLAWMVWDYRDFQQRLPRAVSFKEAFHARHDPELGWVHIPGTHLPDFYGPGKAITINKEGFRGREDYVGEKPGNRTRVLCIGDSFTLGYGVDDSQTWPAILESLRPSVQAVNMGQGAYSVGQCYLWYHKSVEALEPDVTVLALVPDDFSRMAGTRLINGYGKPTFTLDGEHIVVGNQPVPEKTPRGQPIRDMAGKKNYFVESSALLRAVSILVPTRKALETNYALLEIGMAMIRDIASDSAKRDIPFLLVLLPDIAARKDPGAMAGYEVLRKHMQEVSAKERFSFVDLTPEFHAGGPERIAELYLQEQWNHYSTTGNRIVADRVSRWLDALSR